MDSVGLKNPALLHVRKGRSNLVGSLTVFASMRVVTHSQIMLPYLIITLVNLLVSQGSIQDITLVSLLACCSFVDFLSV